MKYLNIAVVVSVIFFVAARVFYENKITDINTDFSKNYWLHPNNPALTGSYLESIYTGQIVSSTYQGEDLQVKIGNSRGEKSFVFSGDLKDQFLTGILTSNVLNVTVVKDSTGSEQVNNLSFVQPNVQ